MTKRSEYYVVRLDGRGLRISSGPYKDEKEAEKFVKHYQDEIWTAKLCKRKGLI